MKSKEIVKESFAESEKINFPVVCLGASAGGLEAFEQFLSNVPENSGMAYIVIQHLDPDQKGMLPELLQRVSKMKVYQVKHGMKVQPNCVYVIPPNNSLSISKAQLQLSKPIEIRGLRLPIDFFLTSLANECKERAVGIILSGMGSDGSVGVRDIKAQNGLVLVQEPSTAKFDSMPRSAIDAVAVDSIAPTEELPQKLLNLIKHIPAALATDVKLEIQDKTALGKIILLLRTHTSNDFTLYKKNTMYRRIERRMSVHKIDKMAGYVSFLEDNPKEIDILFKELLIGVTNFFRDTAVWQNMKDSIIPSIISNIESGSILRAWVSGCSTGEEAYSLAIIFKEVLEQINPHGGISLQIFATDLDNEAIEAARKGIFPSSISSDVSTARLNRFFNKTEDGYRVNTEIREMIIFAQHNIIMHPPFTKLDILSCRNLLIYMDAELQKKLLGLFYYSINPDGIMILGSSESLGAQSHLFTPIDTKLKIYKRNITAMKHDLFNFPSSFSRTKNIDTDKQMPNKPTQNIEVLANQLLLQQFSPPGVLVNENGDIVYISGPTGKYLEPAVGKANLNIFAMLREGLRQEFPLAFHKAISSKGTVVLNNIKVDTNAGKQSLNVRIQWLDKPEALNGMLMIIFSQVAEIKEAKPLTANGKKSLDSIKKSELEKELQHAHEEMQSTLEEMQTSQEELKSANEELQSTNEELQSTNEELTSSKEEMQSLNEELQTVNTELQSKVDDFSRVNNDMKNLLNSTDIATLFLDKELNIRRFTNEATKIFKLIKSDIGRPLTDLVSDLDYADLSIDALKVLETLVFVEKQIPARDGRWFSVRVMPYRTFDDRIDGLVITFINNSDLKKMETELQEKEWMHRLILNSSSDIIVKVNSEWNILEFNPEAEKFFGKKHKEVIKQNYLQLFIPEHSRKKTETEMNALFKSGLDAIYKMEVQAKEGKACFMDCSINILLNSLKVGTQMIIITKK